MAFFPSVSEHSIARETAYLLKHLTNGHEFPIKSAIIRDLEHDCTVVRLRNDELKIILDFVVLEGDLRLPLGRFSEKYLVPAVRKLLPDDREFAVDTLAYVA